MAKSKNGLPERFIKFLGTAGARFVVARQLRYSAGTWLRMGGVDVMLDPGPGTLVRCWASRPKMDPGTLDAVVLSHQHLDHATDANVVVEAMTNGGHERRGVFLLPREAYETDSPVCRYILALPERSETLQEGSEHRVGAELVVRAVVRMKHGAETYGLVFDDGRSRVGFVVDTYYFDGLGERFAGCDVLVLNVVLVEDRGPHLMHLNPASAAEILRQARPKVALLTHFGMTMLRAKPWEIAERMSQELGLEVVAARDGMVVDLTDLAS